MPVHNPTESISPHFLPWKPVENWSGLKDQAIEIIVRGRVADSGEVDDVTADGSVLWLKHDGASERRMIENRPDSQIRIRHAGQALLHGEPS